MKKINLCLTVLITLSVIALTRPAYSAPVAFNNAMTFDDSPFTLINFDSSEQSSYSALDTYLSAYDAQLSGGSFAFISQSATIGTGITPLSGARLLSGPGGSITINFDTPVAAVGAFFLQLVTNQNPFTGNPGGAVKVVLANGGGTFVYNYASLLPAYSNINGFFGVYDAVNKIEEVQICWYRDIGGIDNIYFSTSINEVLNDGPVAVPYNQKETISLPTYGEGEPVAVPEPTSIILLGSGIIAAMRKRKKH